MAAFAFGLGSSVALASDLPVTKPVPVRWTWTGLYIGGQVGADPGQAHFAGPVGSALDDNAIRNRAVLSGVQAPYKLGMLQ